MTMKNMVEYLEHAGFAVVKEYRVKERIYRFSMTKNGLNVTGDFKYPDTNDYALKDKLQREFLDALYKKWHDTYAKEHSKGDKETTMKDYVIELAKHNTGKLIVGNVEMDIRIVSVDNESTPYTDNTEITVAVNEAVVNPPICKEMAKFFGGNVLKAKAALNAVYGASACAKPTNQKIKKVIFNNPATIVIWEDGTKTVVKAQNEEFDPEKGLAMAISRKALGNKHDYYHTFAKWLKRYKPTKM